MAFVCPQLERRAAPALARLATSQSAQPRPIFTPAPPPDVEPCVEDIVGGTTLGSHLQGVLAEDLANRPEAANPCECPLDGDEAIGHQMLRPGLLALFSRMLQKPVARLARGAGLYGGWVHFGGRVTAAALAEGTVRGAKQCLVRTVGAAVKRVPILGSTRIRLPVVGSTGILGEVVRSFASYAIGDAVGAWWTREDNSEPLPQISISNVCLWCNKEFKTGTGHLVSALSCGHACYCAVGAAGRRACVDNYLDAQKRARLVCPLCKADIAPRPKQDVKL